MGCILVYLGSKFMIIPIVLQPKGFWHAPTKWGLRTKDPAPRVELVGIRVSDDEDPQGFCRAGSTALMG